MASTQHVTEPCFDPPHLWEVGEKAWFCKKCGLVAPLIQITKNGPKGTSKQNKLVEISERDGEWFCFYCEHELHDPRKGRYELSNWWPTLDHLLPRSLGGSNHTDNLVLSCKGCNNRKGDHVRFLADVITRQRKITAKVQAELDRAHDFIEHLQWELFDVGLGEIPGRATPSRGSRKRSSKRPRPYARDVSLITELGDRVYANLRAENSGGSHARTASILKRTGVIVKRRKFKPDCLDADTDQDADI